MTIEKDGTFGVDTKDQILDAMIADAKQYWGEDLKDQEEAVIRMMYEPIAERFAVSQQDLAGVLAAAQIDNAEGSGLDLLTALIGVRRRIALSSTGTAVFKHKEDGSVAPRDYTISEGTNAQTDSADPVQFGTTNSALIKGPYTEVDSTTYSTSNTSYTTKTSFTVDTTYRKTVDVSADIRTTDGTVAADLEVADASNAVQIHTGSTTNTSFTTSGPTTYDVSNLSGEITVEYRVKSNDGTIAVELTDSTFERGGESATEAPIEAQNAGIRGNVGANTVVILPDPPNGVRAVTNPASTSGGRDEENDDSLRSRTKETLGTGSRASATALINSTRSLEGVKGVSIFINDTSTDNTGSGGLPDHSFELVVQDGNSQDIADAILKTKAAGDTAYSGSNGSGQTVSSELPNGQTHDVSYSVPNEIKIYVDMDLKVTDEYVGDDEIRDSIIQYIGGLLASANDEAGELLVGDDVLYGRVEYAVRDVQGVYDVNSLYVDTTSDPTATSDISIADSDIATGDATDSSMTIATTTVDY